MATRIEGDRLRKFLDLVVDGLGEPATNGVHFHPPGGLLMRPASHERKGAMDLTDRLLEHDLWLTRRLLEAAASLTDDQLDEMVELGHDPQPYESEEPTVRSMFDR